jgi:hypothetical protein
MNNDVLEILLSILAAVLSGGVGILTIYLKKKWSSEDFARALVVVDEMVRAAEMIGAQYGWSPEQKKAEALAWIAARTGLSEAETEQYVEAAVARLKAAGEELTKRGGSVVNK